MEEHNSIFAWPTHIPRPRERKDWREHSITAKPLRTTIHVSLMEIPSGNSANDTTIWCFWPPIKWAVPLEHGNSLAQINIDQCVTVKRWPHPKTKAGVFLSEGGKWLFHWSHQMQKLKLYFSNGNIYIDETSISQNQLLESWQYSSMHSRNKLVIDDLISESQQTTRYKIILKLGPPST